MPRQPRRGSSNRTSPPTYDRTSGQKTTGLWQVCGCAGLCAFGTTIGLVAVLYELGQHTRTPIGALGYASLALWAGAALGAGLRHRLLHTGNINANKPVAGLNHEKVQLGVEFEFAASLAGGLILVLGLTWLLVCGVAAGMESCRAFFVQHFLLPPWLTKGLVLGPGLCGLLLVGVIGSTTLIAQRGWLRLLVGPLTNHEPLWLAILCGSITGAGLTIVIANWGDLVVATLTPIFVAALLAVYRRAAGIGPHPCAATQAERLTHTRSDPGHCHHDALGRIWLCPGTA